MFKREKREVTAQSKGAHCRSRANPDHTGSRLENRSHPSGCSSPPGLRTPPSGHRTRLSEVDRVRRAYGRSRRGARLKLLRLFLNQVGEGFDPRWAGIDGGDQGQGLTAGCAKGGIGTQGDLFEGL